MGKLIITHFEAEGRRYLFRGLHNDKRFYEIGFDITDPFLSEKHYVNQQRFTENNYVNNQEEQVGNIYVGFVRDVVKNIDAAFIEYQKGKVGYYAMSEEEPVFLNAKNTHKVCQGDLVLVQLKKEAVKTKDPVLTSKISLTGRNLVLNVGKSGIGFSGKITDDSFRKKIRECFLPKLNELLSKKGEKYGLVIRTNAPFASMDELTDEFEFLIGKYHDMLERARYQTRFSVISQAPAPYLKMIEGAYVAEISEKHPVLEDEIQEILTDDRQIYEEIQTYLGHNHLEHYTGRLRFYQDPLLPLYKLYQIEKLMAEVLNKKVWLKSGAYLVIEPTEAMVVIDVNTGKCIKGKNAGQTVFRVNMEAAEEIAYQLRLRNLSGIIMIDFINMEQESEQELLMEYLRQCIKRDRIRTDLIEMTKLNLVELTRKKIAPPVYEQILSK